MTVSIALQRAVDRALAELDIAASYAGEPDATPDQHAQARACQAAARALRAALVASPADARWTHIDLDALQWRAHERLRAMGGCHCTFAAGAAR